MHKSNEINLKNTIKILIFYNFKDIIRVEINIMILRYFWIVVAWLDKLFMTSEKNLGLH